MKNKTNYLRLILAAAFGAIALASCNTVRGAGQDVENAGDRVQRAAR